MRDAHNHGRGGLKFLPQTKSTPFVQPLSVTRSSPFTGCSPTRPCLHQSLGVKSLLFMLITCEHVFIVLFVDFMCSKSFCTIGLQYKLPTCSACPCEVPFPQESLHKWALLKVRHLVSDVLQEPLNQLHKQWPDRPSCHMHGWRGRVG